MTAKTSDSVLRAARDKLKKTQKQVAEELRVTQAAVSHWEDGAVPRPDLWLKIAKAYALPYRGLEKQFLKVMAARSTES